MWLSLLIRLHIFFGYVIMLLLHWIVRNFVNWHYTSAFRVSSAFYQRAIWSLSSSPEAVSAACTYWGRRSSQMVRANVASSWLPPSRLNFVNSSNGSLNFTTYSSFLKWRLCEIEKWFISVSLIAGYLLGQGWCSQWRWVFLNQVEQLRSGTQYSRMLFFAAETAPRLF